LDYLVIDTPPGTSDEHLSLMEHLAPLQSQSRLTSILVTTPQLVALTDTMKCLSFTRVVSLPVLGLIENMSGYVCPCCGEITNVFSTGGGEDMARREGIPFLGALPIDTLLVDLLDSGGRAEVEAGKEEGADVEETTGFRLLDGYRKTPTFTIFKTIAERIITSVSESTLAQG